MTNRRTFLASTLAATTAGMLATPQSVFADGLKSGDPRKVVVGFCNAWPRGNLEEVLSYLSSDIVYRNIPSPAMHGIEATKNFIAPLLAKATRIEFHLVSIATSDDGHEVLTERVDRLHFPTGVVEIPLMGIFVVRHGKISQWRDYADSTAAAKSFADAKVELPRED